jgi:hypothetical protein
MAEKFWGFMANHLGVVGNVKSNSKEAKAITYEALRIRNSKRRRR